VLVVALLVSFEEPVGLGSFVTGELRISMSEWQAMVFPLAISAFAGAFGGLWSWAASAPDHVEAGRTRAIVAGGWLMFLLALGLSYVGLFVTGIVQPDEPVATATPSTARYFTTVFERPGLGAAVLAHHLALAPNEALWTLVPAAGGCDVVRGIEHSDLLCYRRFPSAVSAAGEVSFGSAPAGYLAFLLVPAVATIAGGRWAAATAERGRGAGAAIGAASGVVFGLSVLSGCLLASITLSYGAISGATPTEGHLWVGPDPLSGTLVALAWGLVGGAIGGASAGVRRPAAGRQPAG
jgi:hypothetical protein